MWLGFIGAAGQFCMIKAFERAPVSLLAPFDYMALIWATLLGFLVFGDLPGMGTILGAVIIVLSGLYLIRRETNHIDV
jgi:drug/metabolite transporter (DMT)-like permease